MYGYDAHVAVRVGVTLDIIVKFHSWCWFVDYLKNRVDDVRKINVFDDTRLLED